MKEDDVGDEDDEEEGSAERRKGETVPSSDDALTSQHHMTVDRRRLPRLTTHACPSTGLSSFDRRSHRITCPESCACLVAQCLLQQVFD